MGTRRRRALLCVIFTVAAAFVALTLAAAVFAPAVRAQSLSAAPGLVATAAIQQTELLGPDGAAYDWFGFDVAIDGDTAFVGAPTKTVGSTATQGVVYVYSRSGGSWTLQQTLLASDPAANDLFGFSVALDGDVALVGARGKGSYRGAVYVFAKSGGAWTQQAKLLASDGVAYDSFGWRLAVNGSTALIGTPEKGSGGSIDVGAAYVFTRSGDTWTQQAELTANDGAGWDFLGQTVALDGDTALIGATAATVNGHSLQGAAYVFTRSGDSWSQQAKLVADDGAASDGFGSVALSGDTALIGANGKTVAGHSHQGAVYVFTRSGGVWTQQAKLTQSDGAANDAFGAGVALESGTAAISAVGHAVGGNAGQGAVYLFAGSGASWTQQAELTAADGVANDAFGSIALSGREVLVGDRNKKVGDNVAEGAAYLFGLPSTITPSVSGGHGTISPAGATTFDYGATPTFTFAPDSGYRVDHVLVDGTAVTPTTATTYTFPAVTADHTIRVSFSASAPDARPVITSSVSGGHGTISPAGATTFDYGATPTFTFAPDSGYRVDHVLVDGTAVTPTTATTYTFPAVTADHTISVSFSASAPPVTTVSGRHRGWSRQPVKLHFTATPGPGGARVAYAEYQVDGGAWTRGTSLNVRTQGVVLVRYRSADTLGDVEQTRTCRVRVDTLRPRVIASHTSGHARGTVHLRYRVDDPVPGCGWALVRLAVTNGRGHIVTRASTLPAPTNDWRTVRISTRSLGPGVYTVALRAMDVAGNFQHGLARTTLTVR
jgi:hypothetical protein